MNRPTRLIQIKLLFSCFVVLLAVAHMRWPEILDQFSLLIILVAMLPWITPCLRSNFKSIEAFGAKLDLVERKIEEQGKRINDLYILSMGKNVFRHLSKLRDSEYGPCQIGPAVPRELGYLEALGFIEYKGKLKGLYDFLEQFKDRVAPNLSEYIELSETGKQFLKLRKAAVEGEG